MQGHAEAGDEMGLAHESFTMQGTTVEHDRTVPRQAVPRKAQFVDSVKSSLTL